ncbi:hypothetical protein QUF64_07920 [Anaerolineales bacterium HSG6]|nr:hypothetical protein [Anaerolineales bacterium HSG6]
MSKSKKPSKEVQSKTNQFLNHVEETLKHLSNPVWLERESPLTASYFLGDYLLDQDKSTPQASGKRYNG